MLCVSADTMAKFKYASVEFLDTVEDAIETFKTKKFQLESGWPEKTVGGVGGHSLLLTIRIGIQGHLTN